MQLVKSFCAVVGSLILIGCSNMQLYYVKNAEMIAFSEIDKDALTANRPESVKLLLNGHYVKSGNSLVLIIRKFDKGSVFTVDDENYEKLTIEIKKYTIGEPIKLGSPSINFYYSNGSSGFVFKGHGVYSTSGSGSIIVKKVENNTIVVELDVTIQTEPAGPFPFEGKKIEVKDSLSFKEKLVADLTPWLGVPAPSLGKEVYP